MPYLFAVVARPEGTDNPAVQETKLRNPLPKRPRPAVLATAGRRRGETVLRLASGLLLAVTLLAGPAPRAVAQTPAPPKPEQLWRQFPLDSTQSNPQPPAAPKSPAVSTRPPASRDVGEETRDGSQTVQIAAIVLAMALVLILTTGMLAYATHGRLDLPTSLRLRRWFRQTTAALPSARTEQRQHGAEGRLRPRLTAAAAARLRQVRALVSNLREQTVSTDVQKPATKRAIRRTQRLDADLPRGRESTPDEELEKLKAKRDVRPASTGRPAEEELEILKAKRSKPAAVEVERPDDVETLKAKLSQDVERAKVNAKRNLAEQFAGEETRASTYAGGSGVTAGDGEPETPRAEDSFARTNTGR